MKWIKIAWTISIYFSLPFSILRTAHHHTTNNGRSHLRRMSDFRYRSHKVLWRKRLPSDLWNDKRLERGFPHSNQLSEILRLNLVIKLSTKMDIISIWLFAIELVKIFASLTAKMNVISCFFFMIRFGLVHSSFSVFIHLTFITLLQCSSKGISPHCKGRFNGCWQWNLINMTVNYHHSHKITFTSLQNDLWTNQLTNRDFFFKIKWAIFNCFLFQHNGFNECNW